MVPIIEVRYDDIDDIKKWMKYKKKVRKKIHVLSAKISPFSRNSYNIGESIFFNHDF